jgi:hypothetical protein
MDDSVTLQVLWSDRQLGSHLVHGGFGDGDAHGQEPSVRQVVHALGEVAQRWNCISGRTSFTAHTLPSP